MAAFQISFNDAHTKNMSSTFAPSKFAFYHFSRHVSLSLDVILLQNRMECVDKCWYYGQLLENFMLYPVFWPR